MQSYWDDSFRYGHGGLLMVAVGVLAHVLVQRFAWARASSRFLLTAIAVGAVLVVAAELVLSTWYLLSPSYIDHIEPTIAVLATYLRQGAPIFPPLGSHTSHGLLYGPLLAELTSLGYFFDESVIASKLVGWSAAWTSVVILVLSNRPARFGLCALAATTGILAALVSFGPIFFWNRADPLLLLCATIGLAAVRRWSNLWGLAIAALLAGAAVDLKVHGPLYLAPGLWWWFVSNVDRSKPRAMVVGFVLVAAAIVGASLPFLPENVSLRSYAVYLSLAVRHGLSARFLFWNLTLLVGLWTPIVLAMRAVGRDGARRSVPSVFVLALLGAELIVATVASKPGAGAHHFLPFLGYHLFALQRLLASSRASPASPASAPESPASAPESPASAPESPAKTDRVLPAIAAGLLAMVVGIFWPAFAELRNLLEFDLRLPVQQSMQSDLQRLAEHYPQAVMGIAGTESYDATFLRPWLVFGGAPQLEYGAMMDLELSGRDDASLTEVLGRCEIRYLFIPKIGAPFTMLNYYEQYPMFTDKLRRVLAGHYRIVDSSIYFDVLSCREGSLAPRT